MQYGHDRDSNVIWRDDAVNSAFGELYSYDGLNQITSFERGTLNGTKDRPDRLSDLWRPVLGPGVDLHDCLERLSRVS